MNRSLRNTLARRKFLQGAGLFSLSALWADELLEALAQNISLFEQKFGEIRMEMAQQYAVDEKSN